MRILLTTPVGKTRYDYFRHLVSRGIRLPVRSYVPSLALDYLAAALQGHHEVTVLRPTAFRDVRRHLARCDMVGITSTTADYPDALETARRVKGVRPDRLVVMGGPHVTIQDVETGDSTAPRGSAGSGFGAPGSSSRGGCSASSGRLQQAAIPTPVKILTQPACSA